MIRTLLAMPDGLLRGGLRFVLSAQDDIRVLAEHDSLAGAIAAARTLRADVTILDVGLVHASPGHNPATLPVSLSGSRVLLLVDPRRPAALSNGLVHPSPAVGFLAQSVPPEQVVDAVRRLYRREPVIDASLVAAALRARNPLTAQEVRILQAAALGMPVKEIAHKLGLSPGTVRNYLSRVIAKTGARTRIEAVHIAQEAGWF